MLIDISSTVNDQPLIVRCLRMESSASRCLLLKFDLNPSPLLHNLGLELREFRIVEHGRFLSHATEPSFRFEPKHTSQGSLLGATRAS